ncbi:uncharacterized protein LOC129615937 [Condylostylus longicornis]|uniref:uncharacterized protein LOC129615937 n=1 Tax=Condylostylus longicornis TaxID=2530218 RepID=UPI00244DC164|nr:uncharacterized protein LOC129615937 [Condylostylus longicornis]
MPGLEDNSNIATFKENQVAEDNLQSHDSGIQNSLYELDQQDNVVRETTQTDHLNQKLLKSFLERMKNSIFFQQEFAGIPNNSNDKTDFEDDSL